MRSPRKIAFRARLVVAVLDVTERTGTYLEGTEGWGEFSPLPSWGSLERELAMQAAIEAATMPFPAPLRTRVEVNAMIPRLRPEDAARMALASGCQTVKVKVGDTGGLDRVAAVRAAVGERVRLRIDANGSWTPEQAIEELAHFARYDIELCEDPCATLEDIACVRRSSPIPVGVESCIRTLEDAAGIGDAADVFVVKPQRIGGIRAALRAAAAAGIATIASSALETSVGLAAVVAVAAALPSSPFAHGVGTALLLRDDPSELRLAPIGGTIAPRRVAPAAELLAVGGRR